MSEYLEAGLEQIKRAEEWIRQAESSYLSKKRPADTHPPIRLRRYIDGSVAILGSNDHWIVVGGDATYGVQGEICVTGPGWSELFVAELPEPDSEDPDGRPVWTTAGGVEIIPYIGAVSVGGEEPEERRDRGVEDLIANALKMLAAAASEQYRAEREQAGQEDPGRPGSGL